MLRMIGRKSGFGAVVFFLLVWVLSKFNF